MTDALLKGRLQNDMKDAMRAHDQQRLDAIRFVLSAVKQREVDERIALDDSQVTAIIEKLIKQRKDAMDQFAKAGRDDLVQKEAFELKLLQTYLPEQLSEQVVSELIQKAVKESGATSIRDMGKIMAILKPQIQGRADIGKVSAAIKALF